MVSSTHRIPFDARTRKDSEHREDARDHVGEGVRADVTVSKEFALCHRGFYTLSMVERVSQPSIPGNSFYRRYQGFVALARCRNCWRGRVGLNCEQCTRNVHPDRRFVVEIKREYKI